MSGVIVNYNNSQLTSMSSSGTKTLLTSGKYCENDFEVVYDAPTTSSLTVTPTETSQTFNATGVYGYKPVTVNAISSTYIGTGVTTRSAADLSIWQSRITAPSGYYSSNASIYMSAYDLQVPTTSFSQTTGTFVASCSISTAGYYGVQYGSKSQSLNTLPAQTFYPSTADQYVSSYRWLTGSQTIASVTTSNLTAANIAEGVTVKVGDSSNASRITQVTGTLNSFSGPTITGVWSNGNPTYTCDKTYSECINLIDNYAYVGVLFHEIDEDYDSDTLMGGVGGIAIAAGEECIDYAFVTGQGYPTFGFRYYSNNTISFVETPTAVTTLNVTSNGTYTGHGTNIYSIVNVSVAGGGGFTADNIAMRTISGDISGSTTSIGNYAFYGCYSLTTVSFPNVTSIGTSAFYNCTALTTASFPNATTIMNYAFAFCSALTTASFPSVLTIRSAAFSGCAALTTVSFPNATMISTDAFNYCSILTTASFPNVTSISGYAFAFCYSLTTVSFPNVTSIGNYAFVSCNTLTTVSFPKVTSIGNYAFQRCFKLLSFYLLGSSVPTLGTTVFSSTPIGGYTTSTGGVYGSIFVPSSLYNSYITATNWSTYSARIVSV